MKNKKTVSYILAVIFMLSLMLPGLNALADNGDDNVPTEASLTISKFSQDPLNPNNPEGTGDEVQNPSGTPLGGVTYRLQRTHKFEGNDVIAVNENSFDWTTGLGGSVSGMLPLGRYSVKEISGPVGYNYDSTEYFVDLPMTSEDGERVNYEVYIYPKNELIRGAVELMKSGDGGEALAGVQFDLYKSDGMKVNTVDLFTNASGNIKIDELLYGDYYFMEVATVDDYLMYPVGTKFEFGIRESGNFIGEIMEPDGVIVEVDIDNYLIPVIEKEVSNPAPGFLEEFDFTIKVDLPGDIGSYEKFTVTDTLDSRFDFVGAASDIVVMADGVLFAGATAAYDGTDKVTVDVTDFAGLAGKNELTITFKALVNATGVVGVGILNEAELDFKNSYAAVGKPKDDVTVTPLAGKITIDKFGDKDKTNKLLGAEFVLRDGNGNDVLDKNGNVFKGTTEADGKLTFTDVNLGTYYLHETKAPTGYMRLRDAIEVVVTEETLNVTVEINNNSSRWQLPKTGGFGRMTFILSGLSLMGIAGTILLKNRKVVK